MGTTNCQYGHKKIKILFKINKRKKGEQEKNFIKKWGGKEFDQITTKKFYISLLPH